MSPRNGNRVHKEKVAMKFHERLRASLEALGWNQKRLAEELGSPPSTVSQWIKDKRTPDGEQLRRLAELPGGDAGGLLDGEGPEPHALRRRARSAVRSLVQWIGRQAPIDG